MEDSASEPLGKDVDDVQEKPKDIIQFTAEKLSVGEVSQLVVSPLCGAVSVFVVWFQCQKQAQLLLCLQLIELHPSKP